MLTIIIGIALFPVAWLLWKKVENDFGETCSVIAAMAGIALITCGIWGSLSGYMDWELEDETPLVSLSSQGSCFVSTTADKVYLYRYEIESEFGTNSSKAYRTDTISGNIEEIEDPNCKDPVLRRYKREEKRSKWTLAYGGGEYRYVFYVPEGTIWHEKLKIE